MQRNFEQEPTRMSRNIWNSTLDNTIIHRKQQGQIDKACS